MEGRKLSRSGTVVYGAPTDRGVALTGSLMDLQHKISLTLYAYWDGVRGNRNTPRRFEIDPAKIAGILPSTFILERVDVDTYRFRLAGTRMCEMFGTELRGANFLDGWSSLDRLALVRHLAALAKQGAVERIHMEAAPAAHPSTPFEVLLLPLRHSGEAIDRVLGCFGALDPPQWLGELPLLTKRIIAHALTWPEGSPGAPAPAADGIEVPAIVPSRHARIVRADRRQFRVFEGGLDRNSDKR